MLRILENKKKLGALTEDLIGEAGGTSSLVENMAEADGGTPTVEEDIQGKYEEASAVEEKFLELTKFNRRAWDYDYPR